MHLRRAAFALANRSAFAGVRFLRSVALFLAILAVLLAVPWLFVERGAGQGDVPAEGLPWQIDALPEGNSRVFGLSPGASTLDDARARFGPDVQVAMIVAPGESGSVEAYYESVTAGSIAGKMVLALESTLAQREAMLKRALRAEYMESATRRVELAAIDLQALNKARVTAIAFIPAAHLSEEIVLQRFGPPAERIRSGEHTEHFLYPEKGLDLRLDAKGKEVLQYVAPRDFARLREPLQAVAK